MPVWKTTPVEDEPEITLRSWQIFEVDKEGGDRHFVGWNTQGEGRVSSKIETFDPVTRRGVTRSGRVYELLGDPGVNMDALYVWDKWKEINEVTWDRVITTEALKEEA